MTHRLTDYLRCRNKLLLAHRPNIKEGTVETKSIWDTCTMTAPYLIINEFMEKYIKPFVARMTTASLLYIRSACPALSAVVQMMLAGS